MTEYPCTKCEQNMVKKWPGIAKFLKVCPECCSEKAVKTTYDSNARRNSKILAI